MSDNNENVIEFLRNQETATVCFSQPRYINRVLELANKYPGVVTITAINNDNSIVAHIPTKWVKITPPRQMTEEQRIELADRLRQLRKEHRAQNEQD